ncbi:nitrite/sulfite reductase [Methylibium petroleiphilum]|uniref:Putative nitrite/sulfite reductase n=1 Tax=Methylibium petroleiphilum (strain ATCC BAA-1232 / LMG 22953 / PM1) TaxID=420662 RepID=A2SFX6_METPP|nr:nitrite/sulfite reductase [Methylibium petroleiphilum]ABM94465.1 putative nitrite/sulfite reductase [Methylibium petroleiphilum PM1]
MYQYTPFDRAFVHQRAAQFRDQLERNRAGTLGDDEFRPLRLQNGWYIQRHAPMLRVAVPYGELSSRQLRQLARIAREFDRGYAHFTTRQNVQYNWIPLDRSADVMDLLADVDMHGIQTSGNCIRNTTSDALAGVAPDEIVDPRPYCEILRQWTTLHPEFAFLPRKFKIAVTGATEDRAATAWHDIGLHLHKNDAGEVGFRVLVGGGMGRTPIPGVVIREFLPWHQILVFIEAIVRVYNRYGRRDNMYKARIKILVKAEGERFIEQVGKEFEAILSRDVDGDAQLIPESELDRVSACFVLPEGVVAHASAGDGAPADAPVAYRKWLERNVHGHRLAGYRAVTLSVKRAGQAPGDATDTQLDLAADLADRYSHGETRVTHDQNLLLPWVREEDLYALWRAARDAAYATPNIGLLSDMIACPGGDFCGLANARSIPVAEQITERFADIDELYDIGDIDLHISGCINSCGHHHSGHIGILGVDKDGAEWYQVTLGGSDGSALSGGLASAVPGKVIGPSFAADEVADAVEAVIETYRGQRAANERFIDTVRRVGLEPFKTAANAVRRSTAKVAA